mmetsp:Transcript_130716/g.297707  ORF Transcript_130716/g.297707 Transcript_130716/m.297707 type:complete len:620 (-) Transcript_130716:50-1909(-)
MAGSESSGLRDVFHLSDLRLEEDDMTVFEILAQQPRSLLVASFAALGGFLFGLDTGYIGPVLEMSSFERDIHGGKTLSPGTKGFITGSFSIGCVITSVPVISGWCMDQFGRRRTIILGACIFGCGGLVQDVSNSVAEMCIGRLISGFGTGMLSTCVPVYQTEVAPKETRGALGTLYQLGVTLGILVAVLVDFSQRHAEAGWRWCGVPRVVVAVGLALGMVFLPESPRYLMRKAGVNRMQGAVNEQAMATLHWLRHGAKLDYVEVEYAEIMDEVAEEERVGQASWSEFLSGFALRLLAVGVAAQFLQQLCGINAFMYYGPAMFKMAGLDGFTIQVVLSSVNFIMTIPAVVLVDRCGRKGLLRWTGFLMSVFMILLGVVGITSVQIPSECPDGTKTDCAHSANQPFGSVSWSTSVQIVVSGLLFVGSFAAGWGPVVWVFCAEIFPLKYRSKGVGVTTSASWLGTFIVAQITTLLMESCEYGTFIFYGTFCVACVMFAMWIPETAGVPMEEIQLLFEKKFGIKHKERVFYSFRERLWSDRSAGDGSSAYGSHPDLQRMQRAGVAEGFTSYQSPQEGARDWRAGGLSRGYASQPEFRSGFVADDGLGPAPGMRLVPYRQQDRR